MRKKLAETYCSLCNFQRADKKRITFIYITLHCVSVFVIRLYWTRPHAHVHSRTPHTNIFYICKNGQFFAPLNIFCWTHSIANESYTNKQKWNKRKPVSCSTSVYVNRVFFFFSFCILCYCSCQLQTSDRKRHKQRYIRMRIKKQTTWQ